jgi:RND family efflux transporter MFP subunit
MVALTLLMLLTGCKEEPATVAAPAGRSDAVAARSVEARAVRYRPEVELTGTLGAVASVQLGFDVPGRVEKLLVERGARVRKGDKLARLDPAMARAQLAQAEAAVAGARAQLVAGEASLARLEKLKGAGGVSEQQWADAQAALAAGRAGVAQAEAARELAATHLDNHVLVSPISGIVSNGPDNAGMMVGAGTPLFVVEDLSALHLKATAPESASWLAEGQAASVLVPGGEAVPAVVKRVIPSLDPQTRRIPVEVRVDDPPASLRANAFARVRVQGAADIDAFEVPSAAVVARPDFCVFVDGSDGPRRVGVRLLERRGDVAVVTGDLGDGARVRIDPPRELGADGAAEPAAGATP